MRWFTSDWHIGHANILKYCDRPFADADAMTEEIVRRFNACVAETDEVYLVGDFSLSERYVPLVFPRLRCKTIHLVPGNHDACHPCHRDGRRLQKRYLAYGFASVEERLTLKIGAHDVLVCHMPYLADARHGPLKYSAYRPKDEGLWLLHGHIHSTQSERLRPRQIDVGVDAWDYAPVSEEEILKIVES